MWPRLNTVPRPPEVNLREKQNYSDQVVEAVGEETVAVARSKRTDVVEEKETMIVKLQAAMAASHAARIETYFFARNRMGEGVAVTITRLSAFILRGG